LVGSRTGKHKMRACEWMCFGIGRRKLTVYATAGSGPLPNLYSDSGRPRESKIPWTKSTQIDSLRYPDSLAYQSGDESLFLTTIVLRAPGQSVLPTKAGRKLTVCATLSRGIGY